MQAPPLLAPSLPPSPDPSGFTFGGLNNAPPSNGRIQLRLTLSLYGGDILPYRDVVRDAITAGLQQTLASSLGMDLLDLSSSKWTL